MSKSEFSDWFVVQHKPRNASGLADKSDQQLRDMAQAGRIADHALGCRELWDDKRQSSLYAWTAAKSGAPNAADNRTA